MHLTAPQMLKDFVSQYSKTREMFDLKERHNIKNSELPSKNSFFNNFTIDVFFCSFLQYV